MTTENKPKDEPTPNAGGDAPTRPPKDDSINQ